MSVKGKSLRRLKKEVEALNKKLAPYFEGQPLINKVWHSYNEDTKLGKMLRYRDKVRLQIYRLENNGKTRRTSESSETNS